VAPSLGGFPFTNAALDAGSITLTPPSSNSPGAWSYVSDDPTIVSIIGNVATLHRTGYTRITANQAASGTYDAASKVGGLLVTIGNPSIQPWADQSVMYLAKSYQVTAPLSKSNLPFIYSVSNPRVASISKGGLVTLLDVGTTLITATQTGSVDWLSATANMTLTVKGPKTIAAPVITAEPNLTYVYGDPDFNIPAPVSESTGSFSYSSSNPAVVTVTANTVHIVGAGTASINISQSAAGYYLAGASAFTVNVIGFVPTVGAMPPVNIVMGARPTTIASPSSNSTGTWSYAIVNPKIAAINNGFITPLAVGTTTLRAVQSPNGKFTQSNIVQTTITVTAVPVATPTPSATTAPKPSATPKASAAPSPTNSPSASVSVAPIATTTKAATPKPTTTKSAGVATNTMNTVPIITVTVKAKVIDILSSDKRVTAYIDGKLVKLGKSTLKSGMHIVVVNAGATILYSRTITIA
jgi:cell division septation protein DedD